VRKTFSHKVHISDHHQIHVIHIFSNDFRDFLISVFHDDAQKLDLKQIHVIGSNVAKTHSAYSLLLEQSVSVEQDVLETLTSDVQVRLSLED
jgi:hypothetical protein